MTAITYDPSAWTGRALDASDKPLGDLPRLIVDDVKRAPLMYVGIGYLTTSLGLSLSSGVSDIALMSVGSGITAAGQLLWIFQRNLSVIGNPSPAKIEKRNALMNKIALASILASESLSIASSFFNGRQEFIPGNFLTGMLALVGAAYGLRDKPPENETTFQDVGRAIRRGDMKEIADKVLRLRPAAKTEVLWNSSNTPLIWTSLQTGNPGYALVAASFIACNRLYGWAHRPSITTDNQPAPPTVM